MRERQAYVVEALQEPLAGEVVHLERLEHVGTRDVALEEVDCDHDLRVLPYGVEELLHRRFGQLHGQQPYLRAVVLEDVGEGGGDDRSEAVVLQGPRRVLAAGAAPEVLPCEQDDCIFMLGLIKHEVRVLAPPGEEELSETGTLDAFEGVARHDLVGVHVGVAQGERLPGDALDRLH